MCPSSRRSLLARGSGGSFMRSLDSAPSGVRSADSDVPPCSETAGSPAFNESEDRPPPRAERSTRRRTRLHSSPTLRFPERTLQDRGHVCERMIEIEKLVQLCVAQLFLHIGVP